MNGVNFLADTNALIYLLNGNSCMNPYLQKTLAFSVISEMELLSYSGITETEENCIKSLLNDCEEISLTSEIKNKTIELRKKYKIKLPDAIVAASAIIKKIPLITADKGFKQITELDLELIVPIL
jgi:predicted nucleic acid-binding protein